MAEIDHIYTGATLIRSLFSHHQLSYLLDSIGKFLQAVWRPWPVLSFSQNTHWRKKKRKTIMRFECGPICALCSNCSQFTSCLCSYLFSWVWSCSVCILPCICMCGFFSFLNQSLCLFAQFPFFVCTPINLFRFHIAHIMYLAVFNLFAAAAAAATELWALPFCCEHADSRF